MKNKNVLGIVLITMIVGIALGATMNRLLFMPPAGARTAPKVKVETLFQTATTPDHPLVSMQLVDLPPGAGAPPHLHSGPTFGYIIEGEFIARFPDGREQTLKAGQTYYDPPGAVHLMAHNPSSSRHTKLLAIVVGRQGESLTLPAQSEGKAEMAPS